MTLNIVRPAHSIMVKSDDGVVKEPEWFGDLRKFQCLSEEDSMCIRKAFYKAAEYKAISNFPDKKVSYPFSLKLPLIRFVAEENFIQFEKLKIRFIDDFPKWREIRTRNITSLQSVATYLHEQRAEVNRERLAEMSVSAAGGVVSILGSIAAPFTFGLTAPIATLGTWMAGFGSLANVCSFASENIKKNKKIDELKENLKEEAPYEHIFKYFQCDDDLLREFFHVLQFTDRSIFEQLVRDIIELPQLEVDKDFVDRKMQFLQELLKNELLRMPKKQLPELLSVIMLVGLICRKRKMMLNRILLAEEDKTPQGDCISGMVGIGSYITGLKANPGIAGVLGRGALRSFGVAFDVFSIFQTVEDMKNGSVSEAGGKLQTIASSFSTELFAFEETYKEILNS